MKKAIEVLGEEMRKIIMIKVILGIFGVAHSNVMEMEHKNYSLFIFI